MADADYVSITFLSQACNLAVFLRSGHSLTTLPPEPRGSCRYVKSLSNSIEDPRHVIPSIKCNERLEKPSWISNLGVQR